MKIKLDENLPGRLAPLFASRGHDVDTVVDEDLAGAPDSTVASAASAGDRLVVMMDRGFGDVRRYPPGSHAGILVLRLDNQAAPALATGVVVLRGHPGHTPSTTPKTSCSGSEPEPQTPPATTFAAPARRVRDAMTSSRTVVPTSSQRIT